MFATRTAANRLGSLTTPPVATIAAAAIAHAKAAGDDGEIGASAGGPERRIAQLDVQL